VASRSKKKRKTNLNREITNSHLMWTGVFRGNSGYATVNRKHCKALKKLGVDVTVAPFTLAEQVVTDDEEINEMIKKPKSVRRPVIGNIVGDAAHHIAGNPRICHTMLECTGIPTEWVVQLNEMDHVFVPSNFCAQMFEESGVIPTKISVIPHGVNSEIFKPGLKPLSLPVKEFSFLSVFEWTERKNPEALLEAYIETFYKNPDVTLILKTYSSGIYDIRKSIDMISSKYSASGRPHIQLLDSFLPEDKLARLYNTAQCYVTTSRGEGFGLPELECLSSAVPVIYCNWSGHRDFLNECNAYPVNFKMAPCKTNVNTFYYAGFQWAEIDKEHLKAAMYYVYNNYEEAKDKALVGALQCKDIWSWENAGRKIIEVLSPYDTFYK